MNAFQLLIVTNEKVIFEDKVTSVSVPGANGYFEVLSHHAPLISILTPGEVRVTEGNKKKSAWIITGGLFEVSHNRAVLLADSIKKKENHVTTN